LDVVLSALNKSGCECHWITQGGYLDIGITTHIGTGYVGYAFESTLILFKLGDTVRKPG